MDRFRTMQSFVEVIKFGSFSEAAKMLGFSRALVSRHVTDLEKHLGIRLLTRTTRRITLTEAGAAHLIFASGSFRKLKNKKLLSNGCKRSRPARSRYLRQSR